MSRLVHQSPGNRQGGGKNKRDRLAEGEQLLSRINAGARPSDLMAEYGISKPTLYRRLREAVEARVAPTVDEYRERQNAHLDDLAREWQRQLDTGTALVEKGIETEQMGMLDRGMRLREAALAGMLKVTERRARLMGTDAPVRVDATVTDLTPNIDSRVAELAAELRARASAAAG